MKSSATSSSTSLYNYSTRRPNKASAASGSGAVVAEVANSGKKPSVQQEPQKMKKLERMSTEDVNASAEAFIQNFRQQLLLQRLESIENYEQMLKRGT